VAWEALEHAGLAPDRLAGSDTGVFVGISTNDYSTLQLSKTGDLTAYEKVDIRESASVEGNILAPRVAIADGANFRGSIDMRPKEEPAASLGIVDGLRRDTSSPTPDGAPSTFEAVESRRGR